MDKQPGIKKHLGGIFVGVLVGVVALVLVELGNPQNMGFCIACFLRDIAGATKLHSAGVVQYFRPEIVGLVLGAFIISLLNKEFKPRGGSSPMLRFILGGFVMVGALMFLGCPLRMMLRIGGGDLNAIVGLLGFVVGILGGVVALNRGFSLNRAHKQSWLEGAAFPLALGLLFLAWVLFPSLFAFSESGPGSLKAAIVLSLAGGLVVGILTQRSRLCCAGGVRDAIMFKDFHLLSGFLAVIITVLVGNLILGRFNLGFEGQPVAHTDGLWNFLGMALVGWGSTLLGGCPLRQLILAGEGSSDAGITVLGYIGGAAFAHNFALASSGNGPTVNGMWATGIGLALMVIVSILGARKQEL